MSSMMLKPRWRYNLITVSALALLSGCTIGDQTLPRTGQNDPQAVQLAFQEETKATRSERYGDGAVGSPLIGRPKEATASGSFFTETRYFPYERGALYQLRAAVGSSSTIELQPGETLINYTLGHGSLWIVDTVDGTHQTLLQVKPTEPDVSTHLLINTNKRSYLVEATSLLEDDFKATLAWTYPHEQVNQQTTILEAGNENPDGTVITSAKNKTFSWSRWFADLSKTSSNNKRGCKLCRNSDDHGDNGHGRSHDAADHHGMR